MAKIAIVGASGFLGSPIAIEFHDAGWEVIHFTRSESHDPPQKEIVTNLFDEPSLKSALIVSKPDVVLSTAWDTEHGKFWTNESNTSYRDATLSFAELCFEEGVDTFIGLGTMSEYGTVSYTHLTLPTN